MSEGLAVRVLRGSSSSAAQAAKEEDDGSRCSAADGLGQLHRPGSWRSPLPRWIGVSGLLSRNPGLRLLWGARTVSLLGDAVVTVALVLLVSGRGGGSAVGALLLAQTLPRLLGPFAGTVADRADQRRLMLGCELGQGALVGLLALALPPLPVLLVLVAGASTLATLFAPAGRGALPALVPGEDIPRANALLGSSLNVSLALGPALGGLIVAGAGTRGALALDALSFVVSAALLRRLPPLPAAPRESAAAGFLAETRAGWSFVARHPTARAVALGLFLVVVFAALDNVALVFLVRTTLDGGVAGYGLTASAYELGMVAATLVLIRAGNRVAPTAVLLSGIAAMGAGTLLTGLAPTVGVAVTAQGMAGIGNGLENTANETLIQQTVPRAWLGRVFGIAYGGAFVASSLAYAAGGSLLALTSPRAVFVIAGGGALASLLVVWRLLPRPVAAVPPDGSRTSA